MSHPYVDSDLRAKLLTFMLTMFSKATLSTLKRFPSIFHLLEIIRRMNAAIDEMLTVHIEILV